MKNEDREKFNTKPYIVVFIILAVITAIVLIVLLLTNNNNDEKKNQGSGNKTISERKKSDVTQKASFFALQGMVTRFVSYNSPEAIYNILYPEYINTNGITKDNVFDIVRKNHHNLAFKAQKYSTISMSDVNKNIYIMSGILVENSMETTEIIDKEYSVILLLDYDTYAYNVIPEASTIPEYLANQKTYSVEKNNYNAMPVTNTKSKYDFCELYYNDFVFKINYLFDDAMEYLNEEEKYGMSKKEIKNMFEGSSSISECSYDSDTRVFIIKDSKKNNIRIKENSIMDYTVYLK